MRIIIVAALLLTLFACTDEQTTEKTGSVKAELARQTEVNQPKMSQPAAVDMTAKNPYTPPSANAKDSESFKHHFNKKERAALLRLKQTFEAGMCEEQRTADNVKECYAGHAQMIRSDFFQKIPITMSYPYKIDSQLDEAETKNILSSVWTSKCGYQTDEGIVNYFCLDAAAKVMDYYKEVAQGSDFIGGFTESYIKNKTMSQDLTTNLLMSSGESLDFDNFDHQLFYTILHLTWNEENKALKKLN